MPATSNKQKQFMDAAAHNPQFAKAAGVPVSVAKEFSGASKGMKFGKDTNTSRPDLQRVNKPKTLHGKMSIMKEGGNTMATKKMSSGGAMPMKDGKPAFIGDGKGLKHGGAAKAKKMNMGGMGGMGYAKGGGIESKGKTKGKMIKMNMGGKAC